MATGKKPQGEKKKASATEGGEERRGPSEYARKEREGGRPKPRVRTRFVFKFAALLLVLLTAWIGWILYRSGGRLSDLQDEQKRAAILNRMTDDTLKAVNATDEARKWAEREFKDWEKALSSRLKSPPPRTQEESAALVRETKKQLDVPPPQAPAAPGNAAPSKPAGAVEQRPPVPAPKTHAALAKTMEAYNSGMKDYAMTDPSASQKQVQDYLRSAAGHFEVCLFWIDKARAEGVAEHLLEPYEQPATKRLYDCRKRMELERR